MKKLKGEKGSITLFVLVSMLFFVLFLTGMYMLSTAGEQTGISETARIKEIYEKDINQIDDVYATLANELVYYAEDKNGKTIPVPKGFSPITTVDQGTKETGFVIKNDTDGNEFVWVPVEGMGYSYGRYVFLSSQSADGTDTLTNSTKIKYDSNASYYFTEAIPSIGNRTELESVIQYGGFYIGRYEVGIVEYDTTIVTTNTNNETSWTGYSNGKAVVQKGQQVWNYITRDKAKEIAESMYSDNDAVTSRLCSSYAWDTALKFIETNYPDYPTNSMEGNYTDTEFEYTNINGDKQTKISGTSTLVPTGQTIAVNNIYDMGGNVYEWTTEFCSREGYYCTVRGGNYNYYANEAAGKRGGSSKITVYASFGFRSTLYL